MSKLHRTESLESLISSGLPQSSNQRRSPKKVWMIVTYLNFFILMVTLVIAINSFQMLQGLRPADTVETKHPHGSPSIHEHPSTDIKQLPKSSNWLSCGNTTEQAIQNGCVFDLMLSTWLHPECYWHDHSSAALEAANLSFFLDEELTVPFTEAASGVWPQHYIWTHPGYHALHCSYMWERQIMAWTSGDRIDTQCWNLGHTKHCAMTVLERNSPYPYKSARLRRGFSDCGRPV